MRRAAFLSVTLHTAVFFAAWYGVPSLWTRPPILDAALPVELVTLDELPKPKPAPEPEKKEAVKPPPAPKTPPRAEIPDPPSVPEPLPVPEPPQLATPDPAPPPPKPKPKPKAKPKPEPKKVAAPPPPKRKPKPPKNRKKKKPAENQLASILKNLAEEKKKEQNRKPETKVDTAKEAASSEPPQRTSIDQQRLARELARKVSSQLTPCWIIPAGAKDAHKMSVGVRIRLNPDGSLRGAPLVVESGRMQSDPFYRAVAESAVRTLRHPRCMPLDLPGDQYDLWKDITFNFDPSQALGP